MSDIATLSEFKKKCVFILKYHFFYGRIQDAKNIEHKWCRYSYGLHIFITHIQKKICQLDSPLWKNQNLKTFFCFHRKELVIVIFYLIYAIKIHWFIPCGRWISNVKSRTRTHERLLRRNREIVCVYVWILNFSSDIVLLFLR